VALIALSAVVVVGAVLSGSWLLVTAAALLSVVLGGAATRITHTELLQARRDAARDRAEQAREYRDLTVTRVAEHAEFAAGMQARVAEHRSTILELEAALGTAQKRAADVTRKMNTEARRADVAETEGRVLAASLDESQELAAEAIVRVAELETELDVLRAELAAWQALPARRRA
jgi:hypothetical protein